MLTVLGRLLLCVAAAALLPAPTAARTPSAVDLSNLTQAGPPTAAPPGGRVRVFLACADCFPTFLREEIDWVDFVRQQQDADVEVLAATNETGSGGHEVVLRFIGRGRFQGIDTELRTVSGRGDVEATRRQAVLRTVIVALLSYVERAGRSGDVRLDVAATREGQGQTATSDDPWRAWVFSLRGGGAIDLEERDRLWSWEGRASADRVTNDWKVSMGARMEVQYEHFLLDDDAPLKVSWRERNLSWFLARSLGPHWSAGLDGSADSSTFHNQRLVIATAPALEYSVFPYEDYASRQLRIKYAIGLARARYYEETVYDELSETRPRHAIAVALEQVQPWGELKATFEFSQYLHDAAKYRLALGGELSWRLTRNLSLTLDGSASRIRDQLALPKRVASAEEVLLSLRALQSEYRIAFSSNITYRFGSVFNNVVNPRFGR